LKIDNDYIEMNNCLRGGAPCLFGEPKKVPKEAYWDYYDKASKSFIYLDCKIHQKYWVPSLLQIEEAEKYQTPLGTESYETPDLQLADQNGRWMTRSEDPDCYRQMPYEEAKNCSICDIVCDIRDDKRYLNPDGSCPYNDPAPEQLYWKINDYDRPCQDFLHPLLLQNIEAINRKRRIAAKNHIWKYLKEPHWMHTLINSGQRMIDVWKRNYKPVEFYYRSFETIVLYLKTIPEERRTPMFLQHIRKNLEYSPSFGELVRKSEYERGLLGKIEGITREKKSL